MRGTGMLSSLSTIGASRWYWLTLLVFGLSLEAVALFYQYVLDYLPCVLCVHARIWVLGLILVSVLGLAVRKIPGLRILSHALVTLVSAGLLERSWMLFGTERGLVYGSCDFDLGMPDWLALDRWFPALFEVLEACGYTPELLLGVTMAEGLLVMSVLLVAAGAIMTVAAFVRR